MEGFEYPANGGELTIYYIPDENWNDNWDTNEDGQPDGPDSFLYSARDNNNALDPTPAKVTISIDPLQDGPVTPPIDKDGQANQMIFGETDGAYTGLTAKATDPDPEDKVKYSLILGGDKFEIDEVTGRVTVKAGVELDEGDYKVTVQATSDDTSTASSDFQITVVDGSVDGAIVHESALNGGSGKPESAFDDNPEPGQEPGVGVTTATGNLLENDNVDNGTTITQINGQSIGTGIVTIKGNYGDLTLDTDTGEYTYTLDKNADHSSGDINEVFSYTTSEGTSSRLEVTIVDDESVSRDQQVDIPAGEEPIYRVAIILDTSNSMVAVNGNGEVELDDNETYQTRLEIAIQGVSSLLEKYYQQSTNVEVSIIGFDKGSNFVDKGEGPADTLDEAINRLNSLYRDSTNQDQNKTEYSSGLKDGKAAFEEMFLKDQSEGLTDVEYISYFLSDGLPTDKNVEVDGKDENLALQETEAWKEYTKNKNITSFSVAVGSSIAAPASDTDPSYLDIIHNADLLGSGTAQDTIVVADPNKLEQELLNTIPNSYGGNLVSDGRVNTIDFGNVI